MSNIIIKKKEKQELVQEYNQCVKALAREVVEKEIINQDLWDRIAEIQRAIRECDILEEIRILLGKQEIIEIPIQKQDYFKALPVNYINLVPTEELYNKLFRTNTNAGIASQDKAAKPYFELTPQAIQCLDEKLAKMFAPQAAEITQETAAQSDYFGESRPR